MEEEFVTYEQALALKELGFYEETLKVYSTRWPKLMDEEYAVRFDVDYVLAPLKQQLFRWFRDKCNQNSFIELVYQDGIKYDFVLYVDKKEEECENYGDGPYKTYEEAENACINKLIEITKQQDNGK
jgi:hypothetical protein